MDAALKKLRAEDGALDENGYPLRYLEVREAAAVMRCLVHMPFNVVTVGEGMKDAGFTCDVLLSSEVEVASKQELVRGVAWLGCGMVQLQVWPWWCGVDVGCSDRDAGEVGSVRH